MKAFVSYLRSIYLHKDKSIFKLDDLPADKYAESLGLPGTPKIKFLSKVAVNQRKNTSRMVEAAQEGVAKEKASEEDSESGGDEESEESEDATSSDDGDGDTQKGVTLAKTTPAPPKVRTKYDRMFERKNQNVLSEHYSKLIEEDVEAQSDSSDDFIRLKRADHDLDLPSAAETPAVATPLDDPSELSNRKLKLSRTKRAIIKNGVNTKLVFDDAGNPHELYEMADPDAWYKAKGGLEGAREAGKQFAEKEGGKMRVADVRDREEAKDKKREKKRKRKEREKEVCKPSVASQELLIRFIDIFNHLA